MPKGHRSVRSQGYYRLSPVTAPSTLPTQYAPISARQTIPNTYYTTPQGPLTSQSMSQQSYNQQGPSGYSNGGPVQLPLSNQQYTQMAQPMSIRASSGAWTPQDDQTLMAARAQGMNWAPIQQSYFPTKTPNACRKRHERLMERRSADDWDGLKLENMAKNYMSMRREIWSALAAQTGEKWNVVEQKCMSQGLKNLQTAARSCARRERMLDPSSSTHPHQSQGGYTGFEAHTDDSGYADEQDHEHDLEAEYDADGASDRSSTNGVQVSFSHHGGHSHGMSSGNGMSSGGHYHSHSHSSGSNGSMGGMGAVGGMVGAGMGGYGMHQGRLPSMDMGIDAIINRTPGRQ